MEVARAKDLKQIGWDEAKLHNGQSTINSWGRIVDVNDELKTQ